MLWNVVNLVGEVQSKSLYAPRCLSVKSVVLIFSIFLKAQKIIFWSVGFCSRDKVNTLTCSKALSRQWNCTHNFLRLFSAEFGMCHSSVKWVISNHSVFLRCSIYGASMLNKSTTCRRSIRHLKSWNELDTDRLQKKNHVWLSHSVFCLF